MTDPREPGQAEDTAAARAAPRKRSRFLPWVAAGGAAVLLVGGLAFTKYTQVMAAIAYGNSFPEPAEAVIVATAETLRQSPMASTTGELQAVDLVDLRVERGGVVARVNFRSGDVVSNGQALVQIDTTEERADLAAAETEASRARRDADRTAALFAQGAASRVAAEQAESAAAAAEARVEALKMQIVRKTIRAPFAGRVGITDLKPGQFVSEGALIARLVGQKSGMYVDFRLPQQDVALIDPNRPVTVESGGLTAQARIVATDPSLQTTTRTLGYRALIADYRWTLPAGSLVTVSTPKGALQDVVAIPRTAVLRSPYGATVFALVDVEGQTRARALLVELGPTVEDNRVIVLSGLEAGTRVAADGVFKLRDGALVQPVSAEQAAAAAEAGSGATATPAAPAGERP